MPDPRKLLHVVVPEEDLPDLPAPPQEERHLPASESGIHVLKYRGREAPTNLPTRHIDEKEAARIAAYPPDSTWKGAQLEVVDPEKHRMTRAMAAHLMGRYDNDMANTPSSEMADARKQSHWLRNTAVAVFLIVVALIVLRVVFQDATEAPAAKPSPNEIRR